MPNFTDNLTPAEREIVRYLLDDVTEEECDRIGERSVVELEYGEFVQAVELHLMEAFIRKQLSPNERELFESNFLVTRKRKERFAALQAIFTAFADERKKAQNQHASKTRKKKSRRR